MWYFETESYYLIQVLSSFVYASHETSFALQLKTWILPGFVAYTFNPSTLEAAAGRYLQVKSQPSQLNKFQAS